MAKEVRKVPPVIRNGNTLILKVLVPILLFLGGAGFTLAQVFKSDLNVRIDTVKVDLTKKVDTNAVDIKKHTDEITEIKVSLGRMDTNLNMLITLQKMALRQAGVSENMIEGARADTASYE